MITIVSSMGQIVLNGVEMEDLINDTSDWLKVDPSEAVRIFEQSTENKDGSMGLSVALTPMSVKSEKQDVLFINKKNLSMAFEPSEELQKAVTDALEGNTKEEGRIITPNTDVWSGVTQ